MSKKRWIAALAATCLAIVQGCDNNATSSTSGDRSGEGKGAVAFRLSLSNVSALRSESTHLRITVTGPGMDPIVTNTLPDTTPTILQLVPCGTRYVQVVALDTLGHSFWSGLDTVEINPDQYTFAKIVLHRISSSQGSLVVDVSLDSAVPIRQSGPLDTVWRDSIAYSMNVGTHTSCQPPLYKGNDSLVFHCVHVTFAPFKASDTIWRQYRTDDSAKDSTYWCQFSRSQNDTSVYECFRALYRPALPPILDTAWKDTTVHTKSLDGLTWCRPGSQAYPGMPGTECLTGRYVEMSKDRFFLNYFYDYYGTRNLCETIFWGNVVPIGVIEVCPTDSAR